MSATMRHRRRRGTAGPLYLLALILVAAVAIVAAHEFAFAAGSSTPATAAPHALATAPTTAPTATTAPTTAATPTTAPATSSASAPSQAPSAAALPIPDTASSSSSVLPAGTTRGPTPGSFVVTVVHGETLSAIALWFTTHGYAGIFRANEAELGPNPNYIVPGEQIVVDPGDETMAVVGAP